VIYADFYAKILDWNFRLVDEHSRILVVVFVSKLNFIFSFRFVDEYYRIFVVVVVFVTKIDLFSSTKIFVFIVVDEKNTDQNVTQFQYFNNCTSLHPVNSTVELFTGDGISFVRSLPRSGVQPTLDPNAEAFVCRPNALAQEGREIGWLVYASVCMTCMVRRG